MPRPFFHVTAELVVSIVDAVHCYGQTDKKCAAQFCDLSESKAEQALGLAVDLGLLREDAGIYTAVPPLASFAGAPGDNARAAMLRVALESYEPFIRFRDRLRATNSAYSAASQTKQLLDLQLDRDEIKDTLISLGTYTRAINSDGGGQYTINPGGKEIDLLPLAAACTDSASAEQHVRDLISPHGDRVDRVTILQPLAQSFLKAKARENRETISEAGNAVESFLAELAGRMNVDLTRANGIGQKLDKFRPDNKLPKKIVEAAKYLGQIRNSANHGQDTEINAQWDISDRTALNYPNVACAFIRSALEFEQNQTFSI